MGILNKIFGGEESGEKDDFEWQMISSEEDLENILAASNYKPQIVFKHSTRCATSYFSRVSLETLSESDKVKVECNMVDVIQNRPVSTFISEKLHIRHESPQLFIIHEGRVVWHGSHQDVKVEKIESFLRN
ncbi:MAG: bacillithiol system redox-active protein YtxJ [Balneolaceae bacterium]